MGWAFIRRFSARTAIQRKITKLEFISCARVAFLP